MEPVPKTTTTTTSPAEKVRRRRLGPGKDDAHRDPVFIDEFAFLSDDFFMQFAFPKEKKVFVMPCSPPKNYTSSFMASFARTIEEANNAETKAKAQAQATPQLALEWHKS
jgi:hypothetical protein